MTVNPHSERTVSKRALSAVAIAQVAIAAIAIVVAILVSLKIGPLIEKRELLETEILEKSSRATSLEKRIANLEHALADKQKEINSAEEILQGISGRAAKRNAAQGTAEVSAGVVGGKYSIVPIQPCEEECYLVVLGSFKNLQLAVDRTVELRQQLDDEVELLYAVNAYFAPVVGVFTDRDEAYEKRDRIRESVPGAYVLTAWGFPFEVVVD
jgi:hypothetical protein